MAKETRHVHINMTSNMGKTMQNANTSAEKLKGNVTGLSAVANKASGAFSRMGGALSRIGFNPAMLGIGGVVAAIGGLISKASSFEKAASGLQAITGATAQEMDQLKASALELGASTKFTANEVLQLQTEFSKLGFTVEEIQNVQAATLDLAAAAGVELGEAASVAGSTLRGFGLDTEETARVVDVMAKSFTTSALDMNKFTESMKLVAPIAKTTGSSIEESSAALAVLADRGISGSMAGTQLRRIMSDLALKTGKDFQTSLEMTAEKLANAETKAEKLAIAKELVGDRAKGSLIALAENNEQLEFLTRSYENADGAAKQMADTQLDNLAGSFTLLKSAFDGFMLSIDDGTGIFSTLARGIVDATTALLNFLTPLNKQSEAMEDQRVALFGYQAELDQLDSVLNNTASSEDEVADATFRRKEMIEDLKDQYPDYFGNLDSEKAKTEDIKNALLQVNEQMIKRIAIQQMQEEIDEVMADAAEQSIDQVDRLAEAQDRANEGRALFAELGMQIDATDPEGALIEMNEAYEDMIKNNREAFSFSQVQDMRNAIRNLNKDVIQLDDANKDLNETRKIGDELEKEMQRRAELLGIDLSPEEVASTTTTTEEESTDGLSPEEKDRIKKKNDQEAALRDKFLQKINKLEKDHEAKTAEDKLKLKRDAHLAELDKLKMDDTAKGELRAKIEKIYDEKIQEERDARIDAFNEKLAGKEANEKMLQLEKQKSDFELELEQLELDETAKAEAKLRIDAWYKSEKDKIDAATKEAEDKKTADDAARIEQERRMRVQMQMDVFDNAARLFGEETALGKAMLVAKQILLAKELVMEAKSSILKAKLKAAEAGAEVSKGTAKAAATLNPFVIAGWAITAAGIISTIATAFKASKDAASAAASGGGGSVSTGGGAPTPQAPAFNVIGQTSAGDNMIADTINQANANPMRAYVVEGDISSSQELGRKANAMASVG